MINGRFADENERLSCAEFAADYVLNNLKNRHMSKRLMFKVSPPWAREYFREHLPKVRYLGSDSLSLSERLRRQYDREQYWVWRKFC